MNVQRPPSVLRRLTRAAMAVPLTIAVAFALPAGAAQAATEVFKDTIRGEVVRASSFDDDGCVQSFTDFRATEDSAFYFESSFNVCTNQEGELIFGEGTPTVFEVGKNLETARVVVDIQLDNGETLHVDNTWTAEEGKAVKERFSSSIRLPDGSRFTDRSRGTFRNATVTGTVPFDVGQIGKEVFSHFELIRS